MSAIAVEDIMAVIIAAIRLFLIVILALQLYYCYWCWYLYLGQNGQNKNAELILCDGHSSGTAFVYILYYGLTILRQSKGNVPGRVKRGRGIVCSGLVQCYLAGIIIEVVHQAHWLVCAVTRQHWYI
jgi:hypothetical protein